VFCTIFKVKEAVLSFNSERRLKLRKENIGIIEKGLNPTLKTTGDVFGRGVLPNYV